MKQRIAVIGLGQMGGRIAARLLQRGHRIGVFDTDPERVAQLVALGATRYPDLRGLGAEHDVVLTVLPDAAAVRSVVLSEGRLASGMAPGSLLIDMTSSIPSVTQAISAELARAGIRMLDAPVSGGVQKAETGELTIMAGGAAPVLDEALPVLRDVGSQIFHVGPIGAGHTAKALNNLITATTLAITSEAMALGVKLGVDAGILLDVINAGSGRSAASETKFPQQILSRKFTRGFSMALMCKDVGIAVAMARDAGAPAQVSTAVHGLWRQGVEQGHGEMDHTAIALVVERLAGVRIGATE